MNAEDCRIHRPFIDKTIFYPWICGCSTPMVHLDLVQCEDCEAIVPLLGDEDTSPQDEGWCPVCTGTNLFPV